MEERILVAREGYRYTNGQEYGFKISLGKDAAEEDWWEITEEEYQQIIQEELDRSERLG
jgi:hypothetical protein